LGQNFPQWPINATWQGGKMHIDDSDRLRRAQSFMGHVPFCVALGMRIVEFGHGTAMLEMPYSPDLGADAHTGSVHSGAVSALMDMCAGVAVISRSPAQSTTATLDLRVDYLRPCTPNHAIIARAECYHIADSVAFVRVTAWDVDQNTPIATATGAFTVIDLRAKSRAKSKGGV
jgi:uncharacterized protein (TIGR00369 family)